MPIIPTINDTEYKISILRNIYRINNKSGILLEKQNNISWLLGGRTHVNLATVNGVADIVINDDGIFLVTNNIEAKRIINEELSYSPVENREYLWYEPMMRIQIIKELTCGNFITDSECENDIKRYRLIMTMDERTTYLSLGKDTADAMQKACQLIRPGMTEYKVAAILGGQCMERGIEPIIVLVAADERINLYRHPLPTGKTINDYVMLVLGGRRFGQIACITRFVAFSEPSETIKRKRDSVLKIDTFLMEETRPGANIGCLFQKLVKMYEQEGFSEEWKLHHQGGLTGYNSRENKADFSTNIEVMAGQVYSWNPSITGFKAEDTFIVEENRNTVITETLELPYITVMYNGRNVQKPDIFVRRL